jgi:hypothetical protein
MSRNRELSQFPEFLTINDAYGSVGIGTSLTVSGIGTFADNLYVGGTLFAPSLNITGGASLGDDLETRNILATGITTVGGLADLNGDLDVDGHTELDNLNVSGVSTFVGVSTFQDKVVFDSTNSIQIPAGDTSQRDPSPVAGQIRYNSQLSSFEGYGPGNAWGSLGGVKDVNQDTYIIPELSAGSNEDTLYFYNAGSNTATISSTTATINVDFSVAGVSTFVGIVTTQDNVFVGNDLSVAGDARIVGVLTVGSSSVTLNGDTNTISVGSGVTIHTTTSSFNQLQVSGVSTFVGVTTFQSNVYAPQLNVTSLIVDGGASLGEDIDTRNLNATGIVTAVSFDGDLNALGNTYYVSTTGSDSNSGDNINEPYRTIAQALSVATNGDIVNISAGVYEETCPLTVPRGVTVKGAGLRATTIKPTNATKTNNIFLLNDITTLEDFTIRNSYFNSTDDTGYSFSYAPGIAITTRSPYIQRVTVLNTGSTVTTEDPYGYDTADSPPTSYIAGAGAKADGSLVSSTSLEAGMLFNEVTFFTPNNKGIVLTNGARAEYLNCFHYFASQAIVGTSGTVGIGSTANARLKLVGLDVSPTQNQVVKLYSGGSPVAVGTVFSFNDPYVTITGKGYGTFTSVGIGSTQDVRVFDTDGTTQIGTAGTISFADYKMFGAEMRSVGCAVEYGAQGVAADGPGVQLRLFAMNFNHVGTGKDFSNDPTLVIQANEVVETNGGQVSYVSIDQGGDFRVGDSLYINQETGNVSFAATTYDLEVVGNLNVTDVFNTTAITPTSVTVGNLQLSANTFSSVTGDINIDPAGSNETNITGNLNVSGILTASVLQVAALQKGDTSIALDDTGSDGTIRINTDGTEVLRVTNSQRVGIGSQTPLAKLDVRGGTQLDNVNVSGVLTATSAIVSGDLTVGGVLKYEDVTNVDALGIVTARSGVRVTAGGLEVTGVSTFNNNVRLSAALVDYYGNVGAGDSVLVSTGTGARWLDIATAALQGVQGIQGIQGIQGAQGVQGTQGTQGTFGTQGIQGIQGTPGPVGASANQVVFKDASNNPAGSANLTFDGGTLNASNVNVSGVVTATSFSGDGSLITGVSGFATALSNDQNSAMNKIFIQPKTLYIPPNTQADVEATVYEGNVAFIRERYITVGSGATLHIGAGTTMRVNILGLF